MNIRLILLLSGLSVLTGFPVQAADSHDHHSDEISAASHQDAHHDHDDGHEESHEEDHQEDHHEGHESAHEGGHEKDHAEILATEISSAIGKKVGIQTAIAGSQVIHQTLPSYGTLATGPEQLSHVRARYTGLITQVSRAIGDPVKRGDLLAQVESNESLKQYTIRAPIDGIIIQRHANQGEVTQDQILFSIANFDQLWAELRIYPKQQSLITAGQKVALDINGQTIHSTIAHVIPQLSKPYQIARVMFANHALQLAPGLWVEAMIHIDEFTSDLAVAKSALQTLEGQQGVFVQQGQRYEFTPLTLGRSDTESVEVLSGLNPGQVYVTENSYLLKADIEKSEAEHEH